MAAERKDILQDESGQSIVEFLLMLPMLIGMAILLMRVNMAIQVSIVNQQYARAQTHFLTFSNPYYPERAKLVRGSEYKPDTNQLITGVSENAVPEDANSYVPEASETMVARNRRLAGRKSPPQEETDQTGFVRVWNTVSLCTAPKIMQTTSGIQPITSQNFTETQVRPQSLLYCRSALDE